MDTKKAIKEYATLMRRVAAYAKWEWWREENAHMRLHEKHHGESKQTEEWRSITPPDRPSHTDRWKIGIPLAVEIVTGGGADPFKKEWEEMRGTIAMNCSNAIYEEVGKRHEGFVSSISYGWGNVAESAEIFADYLSGLPIAGKEDCTMTKEAFAKLCGVCISTVKNWNAGKVRPPTVYNPVLKQDVTYSKALLNNPIEAERFALQYKEHKRIKRAERKKVSYRGEETDRMNERVKRGYPKSTAPRKADYDGENISDAESRRRLGYVGSSWNEYPQ